MGLQFPELAIATFEQGPKTSVGKEDGFAGMLGSQSGEIDLIQDAYHVVLGFEGMMELPDTRSCDRFAEPSLTLAEFFGFSRYCRILETAALFGEQDEALFRKSCRHLPFHLGVRLPGRVGWNVRGLAAVALADQENDGIRDLDQRPEVPPDFLVVEGPEILLVHHLKTLPLEYLGGSGADFTQIGSGRANEDSKGPVHGVTRRVRCLRGLYSDVGQVGRLKAGRLPSGAGRNCRYRTFLPYSVHYCPHPCHPTRSKNCGD